MALEVIESGLATTVQDQGRVGYYNVGIPQSGAMDSLAAEMANVLVGNPEDAAVLECTYIGPRFRVTETVWMAVAGAPVDVKVNSEPAAQWEALQLEAGDEVSFGVIKGGTRYYLAFTGGIDVPVVLGSRSTYALGGLGGFEGRALKAGDNLSLGDASAAGKPGSVPEELRPAYDNAVEIRVVRGLYDHRLSDEGREAFYGSEWVLSPVADRIGLRFKGPGVKWHEREQPFGAGSDPSNIVDAGYAVGSIQIPGGTEPIILHRDAVSGGGYAMVATVISADMDLLARLTPGTKARFVEVSMDEALTARAEAKARRRRLRGA